MGKHNKMIENHV